MQRNAPKKGVKKQLAKWLKAIPESQSHGSGTIQKRLWKITSDYVRIRDFYKYGVCVATGRRIEDWRDGDAGHFIAYQKCNGIFKFDTDNIFLQSKNSNGWGDYDDWKAFEQEIQRRGIDPEALRIKNRDTGPKMPDTLLLEQIRGLIDAFKELPEKPEYYDRVVSLLD